MMKRMGITDEDLDNLNNEMMQAMNAMENVEDLPGGDEDDEEVDGKTATFPFLNRLFNNSGELGGQGGRPAQHGRQPPRRQKEGKPNGKRKFLESYCISLTAEGQGRQAGPGDRPGGGDRAGRPDPEPPPEEQPLPHRRARRGQDRHCRGPGPADRGGRCAL